MKSRKEYQNEITHKYPPRSTTDLAHLVKDCSVFYHDWRNLFDILSELDYRFVTTKGTGQYCGHFHDRSTGEFCVSIRTEDGRDQVELKEIIKLEPTKTVKLY